MSWAKTFLSLRQRYMLFVSSEHYAARLLISDDRCLISEWLFRMRFDLMARLCADLQYLESMLGLVY